MQVIDIHMRRTYSEVFSIIQLLGKEYIQKLPIALYKNLERIKLNDYKLEYSEEKSIKAHHISRDAISILAFLDYSYWCDNVEKNMLKDIFNQNANKVKNTNILDNLKNKPEETNKNQTQKDVILAECNENTELIVKKENFIMKIMNKIKVFFGKK